MMRALIAGSLLGGVSALGAAYLVYAGSADIAFPFTTWLTDSDLGDPEDAVTWLVVGALIGGGATALLRRQEH